MPITALQSFIILVVSVVLQLLLDRHPLYKQQLPSYILEKEGLGDRLLLPITADSIECKNEKRGSEVEDLNSG